jgi:hypothetical protein
MIGAAGLKPPSRHSIEKKTGNKNLWSRGAQPSKMQ